MSRTGNPDTLLSLSRVLTNLLRLDAGRLGVLSFLSSFFPVLCALSRWLEKAGLAEAEEYLSRGVGVLPSDDYMVEHPDIEEISRGHEHLRHTFILL